MIVHIAVIETDQAPLGIPAVAVVIQIITHQKTTINNIILFI